MTDYSHQTIRSSDVYSVRLQSQLFVYVFVYVTNTFCPLMCIPFVCSESCFYTLGHNIDWVGWRLARGEDGRGWPTRVSLETISSWDASCERVVAG